MYLDQKFLISLDDINQICGGSQHFHKIRDSYRKLKDPKLYICEVRPLCWRES